MGSKKRSRSQTTTNSGSAGGNMNQAMQKLPPVSAKDSDNMYNSILGGQLGVIGDTLGGLIESGQQMMSDNPGMANFVRAVGGQPMQFETPDFLSGLADRLSPAQPQQAQAAPEQQQQMPAWASNLSPEQYQRYMAMQQNRGQFSPGQFNINDYMRSTNLGSQ